MPALLQKCRLVQTTQPGRGAQFHIATAGEAGAGEVWPAPLSGRTVIWRRRRERGALGRKRHRRPLVFDKILPDVAGGFFAARVQIDQVEIRLEGRGNFRMIELLGTQQICVPLVDGYHHPLAAVYRIEVLQVVRELLNENRLRVMSVAPFIDPANPNNSGCFNPTFRAP